MIIGICGLIGSGKDTVAQYLVDSRNYTRLSMAATLKDATAVLFGWDREMLEGKTPEARMVREQPDPYWSTKLNKPFSPRTALQLLGTDLFRDNFHQDVWVIATEKRILDLSTKLKVNPSDVNVVISDIRFPNEIKMIRNLNGQIWHVHRGKFPEWWNCAIETNASKNNATSFPTEWILYDNGTHMEKMYPDVHNSEWAWVGTNFNFEFDNNDTLAVLYSKVEDYMKP